jgi:hypothetical protein
MLGIERAAGGCYSCGCRIVTSDLSHGVLLPLPICSSHGRGYGRTTVVARMARSALRRFGGALQVRL